VVKEKTRRVAPAASSLEPAAASVFPRLAAEVGFLVQRKPRDVVRSVTIVAVGRLPERAGKLPFLGLVAPLNGGMAKDVV
jgi:hypothetical protein